MTLLTVEDLEEHVETDLPEDAIARLIEATTKDITDRYGANTDVEATVDVRGGNRRLYIPYPPAERIIEIKEYRPGYNQLPRDAKVVDPNVYQMISEGSVMRVGHSFAERVIIRYMPINDMGQRRHMAIDLVRLAIVYEAEKISGVGEGGFGINTEHVDYQKERNAILGRMMTFSPLTMFA